MMTELSLHNVKSIAAKAIGSHGAPLDLVFNDGKQKFELTIYTDDHELTNRIAAAINEATGNAS